MQALLSPANTEEFHLQAFLTKLQRLQRQNKDIEIDYDCEYLELIINGISCGCWTPTGALNVIDQYISRTYPQKWFERMGIPYTLLDSID
jgi:hypothetical protein